MTVLVGCSYVAQDNDNNNDFTPSLCAALTHLLFRYCYGGGCCELRLLRTQPCGHTRGTVLRLWCAQGWVYPPCLQVCLCGLGLPSPCPTPVCLG